VLALRYGDMLAAPHGGLGCWVRVAVMGCDGRENIRRREGRGGSAAGALQRAGAFVKLFLSVETVRVTGCSSGCSLESHSLGWNPVTDWAEIIEFS